MQTDEKKYRTVLRVNLSALVHNLNYFRAKLLPETKMMVMVKAFSYGSAKYETAKLMEANGVDYLGVAVPDEGIGLRCAGIRLPIVVMNPEPARLAELFEYNLEPAVNSFGQLKNIFDYLKINKLVRKNIHIKLNSGMNRSGFNFSEVDSLGALLKQNTVVRVKSIFSHLAASDEPELDNFTFQQIDGFRKASEKLLRFLSEKEKVMRHILNSNGIDRFAKAQFDMVRLGIGLYGAILENQHKLKNISTLESRIAQIRTVEAHETVGYNRKGVLKRKSVIATVPVGYADGLNRRLGNGRGKMLVNGCFAPIVGNVCMDTCMIDITDISAKENDSVIIFGNDYSIMELAKQLETIPYEILTSIPQRVKRVYYFEDS